MYMHVCSILHTEALWARCGLTVCLVGDAFLFFQQIVFTGLSNNHTHRKEKYPDDFYPGVSHSVYWFTVYDIMLAVQLGTGLFALANTCHAFHTHTHLNLTSLFLSCRSSGLEKATYTQDGECLEGKCNRAVLYQEDIYSMNSNGGNISAYFLPSVQTGGRYEP